jgi:hypothetical protein
VSAWFNQNNKQSFWSFSQLFSSLPFQSHLLPVSFTNEGAFNTEHPLETSFHWHRAATPRHPIATPETGVATPLTFALDNPAPRQAAFLSLPVRVGTQTTKN